MIYRVVYQINDFPNGLKILSCDFHNGREALKFANEIKKSDRCVLAYMQFFERRKKK